MLKLIIHAAHSCHHFWHPSFSPEMEHMPTKTTAASAVVMALSAVGSSCCYACSCRCSMQLSLQMQSSSINATSLLVVPSSLTFLGIEATVQLAMTASSSVHLSSTDALHWPINRSIIKRTNNKMATFTH
jgi:hypothetical protein